MYGPTLATIGDFEPIGPSRRSHRWTGHEARDRGDPLCPDRPRGTPTGLAPARPLHVFRHAVRSSGDQIIGRHHSPRHGAANHDGEYCYSQEVMSVDVHPNNYPFRNYVPDNPVGEEERRTKSHNLSEDSSSSFSSDISSYSPITQPPRPPTPMPNLEEFLAANPMQRFPGSSSSSHLISLDSTSMQDFKAKSKYEIAENSKRKKGKNIIDDDDRNTRQCRKNNGVRFYPVDHHPP
ncbi:unnamed protein product [Arabidopsis arenosa]|uniref:Uncharacterized protein n=1 Tax=Arabidopsis arenosa TaxID=38785 RepID=A0A8S2A5D2_ARAAE|nr:unnamed protein product [Arabidopsis arenosa]